MQIIYNYFKLKDGTLIRVYNYEVRKIFYYCPDRKGYIGCWSPKILSIQQYRSKVPVSVEEAEEYMKKMSLVSKLCR